MDFTVIATVDAAHAEVIREALAGQGVTVNLIRLNAFRQLDHLRQQARTLVDVEVLESDAERARALLELMQIEAQQAALVESGDDALATESEDLLESDDDRRRLGLLGQRSAGPGEPLSPAMGLTLALLFPVAGPIYAGAQRLTFVSAVTHVVALGMYLLGATGHWYRGDLHESLGLVVLLGARFLDLVATLDGVNRHNAQLHRHAGAPELSDSAPLVPLSHSALVPAPPEAASPGSPDSGDAAPSPLEHP